MNQQQLKNIIEAALLTAIKPLPLVRLQALFAEAEEQPDTDQIRAALDELSRDYAERGIEVKQVSSGFRVQARQEMVPWLHRLSEDRPARYSRALLETLALIAYRQPITRGGIEDIRGVSISSSIVKTLLEREWIRVVGHRDVPGRPALYGTTRQFLDYFNLKSLSELPPLSEMRSIEDIQKEFDLNFNRTLDEENPEDQAEAASGNGEGSAVSVSAEDTSEATSPPVDESQMSAAQARDAAESGRPDEEEAAAGAVIPVTSAG